jgi:NodT family efflux transporter outer membrane factor (OMF) lipoprotein
MRHKKRLICIGIATLFTLNSCIKVGPNFKHPCNPHQDQWIECGDSHVTCTEADLCAWWRVFEDPVLDSMIREARWQNLTLRSAGMRIVEARAILGIAIGEWFPQEQNLVGAAERALISKNAPNSLNADRRYLDYTSGLQVAWELDFWGKFRRAIEAASEELYASIDNYNDVLVILLSDVAGVYTTVRTIQERIKILERNIAVQSRSLEIVDARFRAGMVTELDLQQAKAFLKDTEARLPSLYIDLRQAQNALAVLLGTSPDAVATSFPKEGRIPRSPLTVAAGIPADLITRRPDLRRALHQTAAQSALIGVAMADLYPHLSISGFVGLESSGETNLTASGGGGKFFSGNSFSYIFGPNFAWSIWNYGRIQNKVRVQYSRFYQLVSNYQNAVLVAYREVEDALVAFSRSHERVDYLREASEAAQRSADLASTQYVEGIADYTRVLNSEQLLLEAEEKQAIAEGEIALALIDANRALGGGWDCRGL